MDDCLQILVVLFVGFAIAFGEMRTINMREDISQKDRILFDGSLAENETRSQISCVNQCSLTDRCLSMFYKSDSKQCVLHDFLGGFLKLHPSITTPYSGWKYYEQVAGVGVSTRIEECLTDGFSYDPVVDVCYIIQIMEHDFDLINQHCADLNSELIKITSQETQDWIIAKLPITITATVCIQGNNDNNLTKYQFDDGTPMNYFNWDESASQPNGGLQHYIVMLGSTNYRWHDMLKSRQKQCLVVCNK